MKTKVNVFIEAIITLVFGVAFLILSYLQWTDNVTEGRILIALLFLIIGLAFIVLSGYLLITGLRCKHAWDYDYDEDSNVERITCPRCGKVKTNLKHTKYAFK